MPSLLGFDRTNSQYILIDYDVIMMHYDATPCLDRTNNYLDRRLWRVGHVPEYGYELKHHIRRRLRACENE
jgi:hypothetical protein